MKKIQIVLSIFLLSFACYAQERFVKVDFESSTFKNNPKIPYDASFGIIGNVGNAISFVKVNVL